MQSGDLRDRITFKRRAETKNDGGGLDISWPDLPTTPTVSAKVTSINGREEVIGGVLQGNSYFEIVVRYRTDLEVADQILWRERELNIHSAEDRSGTRQWTIIMASTEAPQGA
jgi:SPP1 family predicted phage head-tail adaptor